MAQAPSSAQYAPISEFISTDKSLKKATQDLKGWLHQTHKLELYHTTKTSKMESTPYELLADFKVRQNDILADKKEIEIEKLQQRYGQKERGDISRAEERVEKINDDIQILSDEMEDKIDRLSDKFDVYVIDIETFAIKLRRTDIEVDEIAVVWETR
jgi:hypothetical protein